MFKMIIGADIVPTETNFDLFEAGDVETLAGEELIRILKDADFRIFNLETPVCDAEDPILKYGPNLISPTRTMKGIKAFDPSLLALANNHILDQGEQGLVSTLAELDKWEIPYMGAGMNLREAQKPYIIEADGKKIGIYNAAEHEFTIATEEKCGAYPFDMLDGPDEISALKKECDFVIALYHGGREHYRYPSPNFRKVCRKMAQKGADVVVCQHSHCVGAMEEYMGSTIIYGQGNFLFDHSASEFWQTAILVKLEISDRIKVDYIPVVKCDNTVRLAEREKAEEILNGFYSRSEEIMLPGFVEKTYREYAIDFKENYLYCLAGGEPNLGVAYNDFKPDYTVAQLLPMINYYITEPHMEIVLAILEELQRQKLEEQK